jgi:hypothetical protein
MIPGTTTKVSESTLASAAKISPKTDVVYLTGSTQVDTIVPNFGGGFSGVLFLITTDGAVVLSTAGNIAKTATTVQNQSLTLIYSKRQGKWFPGAL